MALLEKDTRKKWMKYVGYEYTKSGIRKMQKDYFLRGSDCTGKYDKATDRLLRHLHHVKKYTKNFKPEEFRCGCGGKYCNGYPTWMRVIELKNVQAIRDHYKKPMEITSGLRCRKFNDSLRGSSSQSFHMKGRAVDFYIKGVTDTLAHRKKAVRYTRKLANHHFTYGDGVYAYTRGSIGHINAPSMGNAMHTDTE